MSRNGAETVRLLALNKRSWHHSKAGGSELNLEQTLKRLADRGHEVHLLVGADEGRDPTTVDEGVTIRRVGRNHPVPAPWDVVVAYLYVSVYYYVYSYRYAPDVVYWVNVPLPWPILTRRPRVAIFHHVAIDTFFDTHPFPQSLLGFLAQWIGVLRERRHPTVSVSPSTTEELVSRGHDPDTVHEIRNGLELDRYRPGGETDRPMVLYLGGLERYKGVDRIPAIHRQLERRSTKPVELHVAGRDGPERSAIEGYCERVESAQFHGFVGEDRKIDLLQRAWVFLAPSRVEGWGIAVLEANACGTPAVGSDVKGLRDSIRNGETGWLVDGTDPVDFADRVRDLLENDETRTRFGRRAREWAESHSWEASVDDLERLLRSVAHGR